MIPQRYKFEIATSKDGTYTEVHPVYHELNEEDTKEAVDMFFKKSIKGDVTFMGIDYELIIAQSPSTTFYLNIVDSNTNATHLQCTFRYVDMEINKNRYSVRVGLTIQDGYQKVIANMETEYDLIKLRPELSNVQYNVSNCLQITTALSNATTNIYRQNIVTKGSTITDLDELASNAFSPWYNVSTLWINELTEQGFRVIGKTTLYGHLDPPTASNYDESMTIVDTEGTYPEGVTPKSYTVYKKIRYYDKFVIERNGQSLEYQVRMDFNYIPEHSITTYTIFILAFKKLPTPVTIQYRIAGDKFGYPWHGADCNVVSLVSGELSNKVATQVYHPSGDITMGPGTFYYNFLYSRLLSRTRLEGGRVINFDTDSDIYSDYYRWIRAYPISGGFKFSLRFSTEPTEYGIAYIEGEGNDAVIYYYNTPDDEGKYVPFIQDEWTDGWSLWIDKSYVFEMFQSESNVVSNSNFCEVGNALKAILREIDPTIRFDTTPEYSQFLYSTSNEGFQLTSASLLARLHKARILITQKSNTTKPNPDYFAMKAPITLGSVLELLREAFNVYWFIDEEKRFRLEHRRWFMKNGNYTDTEQSIDLKKYIDKFNRKPYSYYTNKYSYDLTNEFTKKKLSWSEESTDKFTECNVVMLDTYDDANRTQESNINLFTPDIEYCAIFGKELSKDGFTVVVALQNDKFSYSVPLVDGVINGDMDMLQLFQRWLGYGLPTKRYTINEEGEFVAQIPSYTHKNNVGIPGTIPLQSLYTIVQTEVGKGHIVKKSRNLDTDYVELELMYERE